MGRRKMKPNNFRIAQNTQDWWGFTLQRGHAFGLYQPDPNKRGVCYVSGGEPDSRRRNCLIAYQQTAQSASPNCYHWNPVSVHVDSALGKLILGALRSSPYECVQVAVDYERVRREWQPVATQCESQDSEQVYFIDKPYRPNFPTYQSKRPEFTPKLPQTQNISYMAEGHTEEEYKAMAAANETAEIWAKNAAIMHKAAWIEKFLAESKGKKDRAVAENIYNRLYL